MLKTKTGRVSRTQMVHMITGSLVGMSAGFYQAMGLSAQQAIIIMTIIVAVDKMVGMYLRAQTTEPMK